MCWKHCPMDLITKSKLLFTLEFGSVNDNTMQLEFLYNGQQCIMDPGRDVTITHVMDICFPAEITLTVSGKNMMTDTLLDEAGRIVRDKYIKLVAIEIDNIALPTAWMEKKIELIRPGQDPVISNYFGHNGTCSIRFSKANAFLQILSINGEI